MAEAVDRITLRFPKHVDIDCACHPDGAVPQQVVDRLKIDTLGEQQCGARVPKIMKMDRITPILTMSVSNVPLMFRGSIGVRLRVVNTNRESVMAASSRPFGRLLRSMTPQRLHIWSGKRNDTRESSVVVSSCRSSLRLAATTWPSSLCRQ